MKDLMDRESVDTLKTNGFSNADIDFARVKSEQFRSLLTAGDAKVLDQLQLAYEYGLLVGIANCRGIAEPRIAGFQT
jgi:hypothetical protein